LNRYIPWSESGRAGTESESVGCLEAVHGRSLSFFSTTGIRKRGREYIRGRELICAAIDGRIGGRLRCELYILLSLPLVSSVPVEKSRERANLPTHLQVCPPAIVLLRLEVFGVRLFPLIRFKMPTQNVVSVKRGGESIMTTSTLSRRILRPVFGGFRGSSRHNMVWLGVLWSLWIFELEVS